MARKDGRLPNQIRPLRCEIESLAKADGSCRFYLGTTCVIAAVYGKLPAYSSLPVFSDLWQGFEM